MLTHSPVERTEHAPLAYKSLSAENPTAFFSVEKNFFVRVNLDKNDSFRDLCISRTLPCFHFPKKPLRFQKKHSNKKDFKSISFTPIYVTQKLTQPGISQVFTFFPSRDKVTSSLFLVYCIVTISTLFLWCKYAKSLIKKKSLSIFVFLE